MGPLRIPRSREVASNLQKDYNVISNRYNEHHDEKAMRDAHLNKLETTARYLSTNRFNPVTQVYKDQDEDDRMKIVDETHEQEMRDRKVKNEPPCNDFQKAFDIVAHVAHNEDYLKSLDLAQEKYWLRCSKRHKTDQNNRERGLAKDNENQQRHMNRIKFD